MINIWIIILIISHLMFEFNWEEIEKYLLERTIKDSDHIIWKNNNRKRKSKQPHLSFNKIRHAVHQWLYLCKIKIDSSKKIHLKRICDHDQCINPEHMVNMDDEDAVYKLSSYYLMKNSRQEGECHLWTGALDVDGYGCASFKGKRTFAHIVSMLISKKIEKIPPNLIVLHKCPNKHKHCFAIAHLELGTPKDNAADKIEDCTLLIGSKHPNATINEDVAKKIYDLKKTMTQRERALMFNTAIHIVNGIDSGTTWSQVTGQKKRETKRKKTVIDDKTPVDLFIYTQKRIENSVTLVFDEGMNEYHWIWKKSKDKKGYGHCTFAGKPWGAHVVAWMAFNKKPIPSGLIVLHKCKQQPACCNPEHLRVGTHKENSADMKKDGTLKIHPKITEEMAKAVMLSKGDGTIQERADRFGITRGIIEKIDRGRTWIKLREELKIPINNGNDLDIENKYQIKLKTKLNDIKNKYQIKLKPKLIDLRNRYQIKLKPQLIGIKNKYQIKLKPKFIR